MGVWGRRENKWSDCVDRHSGNCQHGDEREERIWTDGGAPKTRATHKDSVTHTALVGEKLGYYMIKKKHNILQFCSDNSVMRSAGSGYDYWLSSNTEDNSHRQSSYAP